MAVRAANDHYFGAPGRSPKSLRPSLKKALPAPGRLAANRGNCINANPRQIYAHRQQPRHLRSYTVIVE